MKSSVSKFKNICKELEKEVGEAPQLCWMTTKDWKLMGFEPKTRNISGCEIQISVTIPNSVFLFPDGTQCHVEFLE